MRRTTPFTLSFVLTSATAAVTTTARNASSAAQKRRKGEQAISSELVVVHSLDGSVPTAKTFTAALSSSSSPSSSCARQLCRTSHAASSSSFTASAAAMAKTATAIHQNQHRSFASTHIIRNQSNDNGSGNGKQAEAGDSKVDSGKQNDAAATVVDAEKGATTTASPSPASDSTAATSSASAAIDNTNTNTNNNNATPTTTANADAAKAASSSSASSSSSNQKSHPTPSIDISTPVPKGFERFYQREFLSQLPTVANAADDPNAAQRRAVEMSPQEKKILDLERNLTIYHKRVRKITVLTIVLGVLVLFKSYKAYTLMSQAPDLSALKHVYMSKAGHVATFYDEKLKPRAMQYFIDARTFHDEMTSPPNEKDVRVGVPAYFPLIPLMLLCLLPVMAMMSGAFNASARAAAKAGMSGGGGGGGGGGMMDKATGGSRFRFKKEVGVQTRLADVAGLTEAKHEVTEVIDFLRNPMRYRALGAKLPKGVLLDGPPGVGKTLLAKAVAGEAMVNFVSCSGSEFEEVYVGVGAQRVRELFKQARAARPCVVFIDEIDAFGRKRQSDRGGNSRSTLNAFLSELDGFHDAAGIIVLAATNRADVLDGAMTRSGRFDRKITIDKPPHKDRVAIAKVHLKPLKLDPAVTLDGFAETLASLTPGCSGADIYNICNEAAIIGSREDREFVNLQCFHKAIDRVLVGMEKKATKLSPHEKARLAYHEAGHAVLNWFLPLPDPITKVSIAPRGTHIGLTQKLPHEVFIKTQDRLRQTMVAKLGGFVSEEFFFSDLSSNAADDLQRVTDDARAEICVYGMDSEIGNFGYEMDNSDAIQKPFGPKKEDQIDIAVARVVESCAARARALLKEHIDHVHVIAGTLIKQETLTAQELYLLLGERPEMSPEFRKYLES